VPRGSVSVSVSVSVVRAAAEGPEVVEEEVERVASAMRRAGPVDSAGETLLEPIDVPNWMPSERATR